MNQKTAIPPSYQDLHRSNNSKVSDKWDLYLSAYDRILGPYRNDSISLLEIGVQNGGSLETWALFFPCASVIIGCDINEKCGELCFDDPRIKVIIGDATEKRTIEAIKFQKPSFNIVIEDGSHTSRDIIRSFTTYFPEIEPGGVYIAEDLHCCYWKEYGGGLGDSYSGIEFFKSLVDCINASHWHRNDVAPAGHLSEILQMHNTTIDSKILSEIESVQFMDSLCIIKKASGSIPSRIQKRIITGQFEYVTSGVRQLSGTGPIEIPQDSNNANTLLSRTELTNRLKIANLELEEIKKSKALIYCSNNWRAMSMFLSSPAFFPKAKNLVKGFIKTLRINLGAK